MINKIPHYTDALLTKQLAREQLISNKISVAWYTNQSNLQSVVHSHPYYEAIMPISGRALYSYNGTLQMVNPGELILFPCNVYHSGKFNVDNNVSKRLIIQFDGTTWFKMTNKLNLQDRKWNKEVVILKSTDVSSWDMKSLFSRMDMSKSLDEKSKNISYECQLTEFMMIIEHVVSKNNTISPTTANALVSKTIEYIQTNYTNPALTVNSIAEHMFVSRCHLSRTFKEYTMESVHSYITNLRMQYFCDIITPDKSILSACVESGFSDYSSFLKSFRKLYGITPIEYRSGKRTV